MRRISSWFKDNHSILASFSSIMLAFFAMVSIYQTYALLKSQSDEEYIKFRAYISIETATISPNDRDDLKDFDTKITFLIRNNGLTPAHELHVEHYGVVNNQEISKQISRTTGFIGPNQSQQFGFAIIKDHLKLVESGTQNYFYYRVIYKDYVNKEHVLESKFQFTRENNSYILSIVDQHET